VSNLRRDIDRKLAWYAAEGRMGDIMETERLADLLSLFYNYEGCEEALMYRDLLAMIKGTAYVALGGLKRMVEGILENKLRLDFQWVFRI